MNEFRLEKWYMDASSEKGQAFIAYAASLQWNLVNLNYSGYTFLPGHSEKILKRSTFSPKQLLQITADRIEWKCFQAKAIWQRGDASIEETLFSSDDGEITWSCIFPTSNANIEIGSHKIENSLGYAEKITLSIPPWKIPIHELHWGRYLSEEHTVIWIQWIGPVPRTLIYFNGDKITDAKISTTQIIFRDYTLELKQNNTLRKGTVLSTVFGKFPSLAKLFPSSIVALEENKWLSDGTLIKTGRVVSSGKAIHELVIWK